MISHNANRIRQHGIRFAVLSCWALLHCLLYTGVGMGVVLIVGWLWPPEKRMTTEGDAHPC